MADIGIQTSFLRLPDSSDTAKINVIQDTNDCAYEFAARHGQNQQKQKNSDYWLE